MARGSKRKKSKVTQIAVDNLLIILITISVGAGLGLGFGLRNVWSHEDLRKIWYLEYPGRLLLNMLRMLILPLVVSSLVTGMASIGNQTSGKLGAGAVLYYLSTTLAAVIIGIVLVLTIKPGQRSQLSNLTRTGKSLKADPLDALLDLLSQCFPANLVSATFEKKVTKIGIETFEYFNRSSNETYFVSVDKPSIQSAEGTNILGIVVCSITLGVIINHLGEEGAPLKNFFSSLNSAVMVLIHILIWYTPIGLMFLVAGEFVSTKDVGMVWESLAMYLVTVFTGLIIHSVIVLPCLFFVCTRKNPFKFGFNMLKAFLTVWGTASSSATLPVTMDCLIQKNKLDVNIVRFIAPIGATINMDGTALYEAVASIFIAQINGFDLSFVEVIIISLTSTAAAIGAAGIPQAGLVTMVIVLTAVGLPTEDITLIFAVDWLVDRSRGIVNVWGDSVGAGILDHFFKDSLATKDNLSTTVEVSAELPERMPNPSVTVWIESGLRDKSWSLL